MIVYESNGRNYATVEKAISASPDIEPVEITIPDGVAKRELGTGEVVNIPQTELDDAIAAKAADVAEFAASAWERGRNADYLSIEDQLDMIYWDMKNGTSTFTDHRDAVKAAHQKPA